MAVLDEPGALTERPRGTRAPEPTTVVRPVRVEPLLGLEWSRAVEPTGPISGARRPSQVRRAWIHRAPEVQVRKLYQSVREAGTSVSAPWWLRALAKGLLSSRSAGFAIEDQVGELLDGRPGWAYMPWAGPGEDGYWEYVPAEQTPAELPPFPTTVLFTDTHQGWLDVVPAHTGSRPAPTPINGPAGLRARLAQLEQR